MSTLNLEPEPPQAVYADDETVRQMKGGANWFFWLAGISLINSLVVAFNGNWSFVMGLGITQIIDVVVKSATDTESSLGFLKFVGLAIDLSIAGFFAMLAVFARKGHIWAFVTGIVFYALDSMIFVIAGDILAIAFHGLALYFMFRGLIAARTYSATPMSPGM